MKLSPENIKHYQTVTSYDDQRVSINDIPYTASLIVTPETEPVSWDIHHYAEFTEEDMLHIIQTKADVVILGTGIQQHFLPPQWIAGFAKHHIGVEVMSNAAACRTYNILMAEGRKVALGLIFS